MDDTGMLPATIEFLTFRDDPLAVCERDHCELEKISWPDRPFGPVCAGVMESPPVGLATCKCGHSRSWAFLKEAES